MCNANQPNSVEQRKLGKQTSKEHATQESIMQAKSVIVMSMILTVSCTGMLSSTGSWSTHMLCRTIFSHHCLHVRMIPMML
jgi:hypothetical protein